MGLAVGLAWIIVGIFYLAYKSLTEELKLSSAEAWVKLCLTVVGIIGVGSFLMTISASDIGILLFQSIIGIGACILLVNIVRWETESYKNSIKEEQLPSEVTKENVEAQAHRVRQYYDSALK